MATRNQKKLIRNHILKFICYTILFLAFIAGVLLGFHFFLPAALSTTALVAVVASVPAAIVFALINSFFQSQLGKIYNYFKNNFNALKNPLEYYKEVADNNIEYCKKNYGFFKDYKHIPDNERTVLHTAAECGHMELLEYFLDKDIDIDALDVKGNTALLLATKKRRYKIVERLLKAGADISIKNERGDSVESLAKKNDVIESSKKINDTVKNAGNDNKNNNNVIKLPISEKLLENKSEKNWEKLIEEHKLIRLPKRNFSLPENEGYTFSVIKKQEDSDKSFDDQNKVQNTRSLKLLR